MTASFSHNKNGRKEINPDIFIWPLIPLIAIALGVVLRITLRSSSFWEDEIIAATHATLPFLQVIRDAFIGDMHPPLYFLELHIWSLFGRSDVWLIANSVVLSLAALVSLYAVARRMEGARQALIVTALFAALPVTIWMAGEVRMYAMLSIMFIWLYYFTDRAFAVPDSAKGPRIAVLLLSIAIIYTHAIGFVAVFLYGIYAAGWLVTRRVGRREWIIWLAIFGAAALTALPLLADEYLQPADMIPITGFQDILGWMASLIAGGGYRDSSWLPVAGLAGYVVVTICGVCVPRTRRLTLCFLIAPLILCAIAELAVKPLFKTNFFPNLATPFLALIVGNLILSMPLKKILRSVILGGVLIALLAMAVENRVILNTANNYFRPATEIIAAGKQPGDVVWAPQASAFWGMAWYLAGPGSGSIVAVRAPLRPGSKWWKVIAWIGPDLTEMLGLIPKTQTIVTKDGLPIIIAAESQPRAEQAKRVWLVTFPRNNLPPGVPGDNLGPLRRSQSFSFPSIALNLYERPGGKQPDER